MDVLIRIGFRTVTLPEVPRDYLLGVVEIMSRIATSGWSQLENSRNEPLFGGIWSPLINTQFVAGGEKVIQRNVRNLYDQLTVGQRKVVVNFLLDGSRAYLNNMDEYAAEWDLSIKAMTE